MTTPFWLPATHDTALAQGLSRQGTPIVSWIDRTREMMVVRLKRVVRDTVAELSQESCPPSRGGGT